MNTQDVYKNVHKIQGTDSTRDGITGLIDIQTNSGIQKVLDKMDAMNTKMDAMETRLESKISTNKAELESKINVTNIIAVGVGLVVIGSFIAQIMKK